MRFESTLINGWTGPELVRRGTDLYWAGCSLPAIARQFGTPLFVLNKSCLTAAYRNTEAAFSNERIPARLFFSVKTNPVPEVLKALFRAGSGAEVISEFEFWLSRRLGCPADRVIVNGGSKAPGLLRSAVMDGVALINVESLDELLALRSIVRTAGKSVNVGLRVNPGFRTWRYSFALSSGSLSSHMGFIPGSKEWLEALRVLCGEPLLRFRGLHFHIGSGISRARPYEQALRRTLRAGEDVVACGLPLEIVDIGGGFGLTGVRKTGIWEALGLLGWVGLSGSPAEGSMHDLAGEVARICRRQLHAFAQRNGHAMPVVYAEPGRSVCGAAQVLLLTATRIAEARSGSAVAVCDGGALSLSPLLFAEHHAVAVANRRGDGPTRAYRLVGSMPTTLDVVASRRRLPRLSVGDVIAVLDTGAYFTSLGNNFAGPRPGIIAVDAGTVRMVRRPETFNDLIRRDEESGQRQYSCRPAVLP